ncbi:MAG: hypothetical protein QNK11_00780 [Legionella sp.]|nr:hypothetical protein [Legionella sp.]
MSSRFYGNVSEVPFSCEVLTKGVLVLPKTLSEASLDEQSLAALQSLPMFQAKHWKARLLGRWHLNKNQPIFKPGLFEGLDFNKAPVLLENAPWDDDAFQIFWLMQQIDNPALSKAYQLSGYDLKKLTQCIKPKSENPDCNIAAAEVLNPTRLPFFFHQYTIDNASHSISFGKGILEVLAESKKPISIYVTDALDEHEWALFLTTCQQLKLQFNLFLAPKVQLPGLPDVLNIENYPHAKAVHQKTVLQFTNDVDFVLDKYLADAPEQPIVIDVSELKGPDILERQTGEYTAEAFRFEELPSYLKNSLKANKQVILKGYFSEALIDALAPFMLERRGDKQALGHLTCLVHSDTPEKETRFMFYPESKTEVVCLDEP